MEDTPKISTGADLSTMSGLVTARRSLLSEDRRDRFVISRHEGPKLVGRFPGSFKEISDSTRKQDQNTHTQIVTGQPNRDNSGPVLVSN